MSSYCTINLIIKKGKIEKDKFNHFTNFDKKFKWNAIRYNAL